MAEMKEDDLNPILKEIYDKSYPEAERVYRDNQDSLFSSHSDASGLSLSQMDWGKTSGILGESQQSLVNDMMFHGHMNKKVYSIVVTSLLKKIEDPLQDITLYSDRVDDGWEEGYNISKYCSREVAPFLTAKRFDEARAGSGSIPNDKIYRASGIPYGPGYPLRVQNKRSMRAAMSIIDDVQNHGVSPYEYLKAIFTRSIYKRIEMEKKLEKFRMVSDLDVRPGRALSIIDRHRNVNAYRKGEDIKNISNLPVLAVWSYFDCWLENGPYSSSSLSLDMYHSHTETDSRNSPGDICLRDSSDNTVYECIDVKGYGKDLTFQEVKRSFDSKIEPAIEDGGLKGGYFYIYTDEPDFQEKKKIERFLSDMSEEYGRSLILISFDDFFSDMNYRNLTGIDCRKWLDRYRKEVTANRYDELPLSLREKVLDIYEKEGIGYSNNSERSYDSGMNRDEDFGLEI